MPQLASADYKSLRESIYERLGIVLVADISGMANDDLTAAKKARNDEFYTQYEDIEKEMNADHVKAWSKGGGTVIGNCEMLCSSHNKAKGNR